MSCSIAFELYCTLAAVFWNPALKTKKSVGVWKGWRYTVFHVCMNHFEFDVLTSKKYRLLSSIIITVTKNIHFFLAIAYHTSKFVWKRPSQLKNLSLQVNGYCYKQVLHLCSSDVTRKAGFIKNKWLNIEKDRFKNCPWFVFSTLRLT